MFSERLARLWNHFYNIKYDDLEEKNILRAPDKRDTKDHLKIYFLFPNKNVCCDPLLESSQLWPLIRIISVRWF